MQPWTRGALLALPFTMFALPSLAEEVASISPEALQSLVDGSSSLRIGIDTVWVLVAGMLVFWMNAGFALVESGLCRAKNTSNILTKNFIVFAASSLGLFVAFLAVVPLLRIARPAAHEPGDADSVPILRMLSRGLTEIAGDPRLRGLPARA